MRSDVIRDIPWYAPSVICVIPVPIWIEHSDPGGVSCTMRYLLEDMANI